MHWIACSLASLCSDCLSMAWRHWSASVYLSFCFLSLFVWLFFIPTHFANFVSSFYHFPPSPKTLPLSLYFACVCLSLLLFSFSLLSASTYNCQMYLSLVIFLSFFFFLSLFIFLLCFNKSNSSLSLALSLSLSLILSVFLSFCVSFIAFQASIKGS